MKDKKEWLKIMYYSCLHILTASTSIAVITSILGFNLPTAFLFAGVGTLIFHVVTRNQLPVILGVSGLYVGSILVVTQDFGVSYAMGGIVFAGLVYLVFAYIMHRWQDKILVYFPDWLLSTTVLLIGLSLLPIGTGMMSSNLLVGLVSFAVVALVNMSGNARFNMFAMPLGVLAGTVVMLLTQGIDTSMTANVVTTIQLIPPKFALKPILTVAPLAVAVAFETLGDTKNSSDIIGKDIFKEVGLSRIFLGNGLATITGGLFGANAYTTYSENNAFVMLSRYYNPKAQLVASVLMMLMAFVSPVFKAISLIPTEAMGGVVTYLFAMIAVNAIKQMFNSPVNLITNDKVFVITSVMLGVSFMSFAIGGVDVSSVAVATFIGTILNIVTMRKKRRGGSDG